MSCGAESAPPPSQLAWPLRVIILARPTERVCHRDSTCSRLQSSLACRDMGHYGYLVGQKDNQTDRQTDRQTGTQTDRQTGKQTDRQM